MIRIFEDQFLALEFTAIGNREFVAQCIVELTDLEEDEGNSWEMIPESVRYFRERPIGGERPMAITNLKIKTADFIGALSQYGFRQNSEIEFVGDIDFLIYRPTIRAAHCYVYHRCAIFVYSEGTYLQELWLYDLYPAAMSAANESNVIDCLHFIGTHFPILLVDWYEKMIVDLSRKEEVNTYAKEYFFRDYLAELEADDEDFS